MACATQKVLSWFYRHWLLRWGVMLACITLVTWSSLVPAKTFAGLPSFLSHANKVVHFFLYGILVALGRWVMLPHWQFRVTFVPLVIGAISYGIFMEILQGSMASYGRTFELGDIIANSLGALFFWILTGRLFAVSPAPAVAEVKPNASSQP